MSFMFKPYRFTDPEALNRPKIPAATAAKSLMGNEAIAERLLRELPAHKVLILDGYVGADYTILCDRIADAAGDRTITKINVSSAYKSPAELEAMLADSLPEDRVVDPILLFGKSRHREPETLFDNAKTAALVRLLKESRSADSLVILYGFGSALSAFREDGDLAVFLDVTPLETTLRIREHKVRNFGDTEKKRSLPYIFRRMYYYDYEIAMLHRQRLIRNDGVTYYIDDNMCDRMKMLPLDTLKEVFDIQVQ